MRRILIESARRKALAPRIDLAAFEPRLRTTAVLELHDALDRLAASEPVAAKVVEARLFAGLSVDEAAAALGLSRADRIPRMDLCPRLAGGRPGRQF